MADPPIPSAKSYLTLQRATGILFAGLLTLFCFYPYADFDLVLLSLITVLLLILALVLVRTFPVPPGLWFLPVYGTALSLGLFHALPSEPLSERILLAAAGSGAFTVAVCMDSRERLVLAPLFIMLLALSASYGLWEALAGKAMTFAYYAAEGLPGGMAADSIHENLVMQRLQSLRIQAQFTNPNLLAGFLVSLLPWAFYGLRQGQNQRRLAVTVLCGLTLLMGIAGVLLSRSRSGILLLLPVFLGSFLTPGKTRRRFAVLWIILPTALVLLAPLWLKPFQDTLPGSFASRLNYAHLAWTMIQESPWLGTGLGAFADTFLRLAAPGDEITRYTHHFWLQLAAECGLPAGLVILSLIVGILQRPPPISAESAPSPSSSLPSFPKFFLPGMLVILAILVWNWPPFTIVPPERSPLFSLILVLSGCLMIRPLLPVSQGAPGAFEWTCWISALVLFLQSQVDLTLDKVGTHVFFFTFLGFLARPIKAPHRLPEGRKGFPVTQVLAATLLGVFLVLVALQTAGAWMAALSRSHAREAAYRPALSWMRRAETSVPWHGGYALDRIRLELILTARDQPRKFPDQVMAFFKEIEKSPRDFNAWYTLLNLLANYPELPFPEHTLQQVINRMGQLAPSHQQAMLAVAGIHEARGNPEQARRIYRSLLENQDLRRRNYAHGLRPAQLEFVKARLREIEG